MCVYENSVLCQLASVLLQFGDIYQFITCVRLSLVLLKWGAAVAQSV
jgi:hypothetical protein